MDVVFQSDVGRRYHTNEDAVNVFYNNQQLPLYLLCDGVGGHRAGEVASNMAVTVIGDMWKKTQNFDVDSAKQWLIQAVEHINQLVYQRSQNFADLKGMSTTIVCATIIDNSLVIAHVGDSRAYIFRHHTLKQLTQDHSYVNELVQKGELTPEEAKQHKMKNVITRAIGSYASVAIDVTVVTLKDNDIIFLCSDGLTDMVDEHLLAMSFKEWQPLDKRVQQWIALANEAGGQDNITILLVHYQEKGDN